MITGKVTETHEPVIELEVIGVNRREKIEAIVDTGFTGELMLTGDLIDILNLPRYGELPVILGDGREVVLGLYFALVSWQGEKKVVQVLRTAGKSLIGMSLLSGNCVTVETVADGKVVIEALPAEELADATS